MVLWGGPSAPGANGLYSASMCSANAVVGTPEGNALLAEANDTFGTGQAPPEPEPEALTDLSLWLGPGLLWAVLAVGAGLVLLGVVTLIARRRPQG